MKNKIIKGFTAMNGNKTMRVYLVTASNRKNYVTSAEAYDIVFGKKEQAMPFSPTDAKILQRILINLMGNGYIENINR